MKLIVTKKAVSDWVSMDSTSLGQIRGPRGLMFGAGVVVLEHEGRERRIKNRGSFSGLILRWDGSALEKVQDGPYPKEYSYYSDLVKAWLQGFDDSQKNLLKHDERLFSSGAIARMLDLSRSAVNHWCRMGLLREAGRTPGNHRLLRRSDVLAFLQANKMPVPQKLLEEVDVGYDTMSSSREAMEIKKG